MKALKNITTISLLFGLLVAGEVFANAGKIIYSYGDNYAHDRDGNQRRLSKNAEIFSGDTLFTSAQGRMQVRFSDGGMVSVYPRSEYKIEQFVYTAENEDEQRGFFSLLKGAARQITGLLGKNKRDNFKFSTTVATIGIRGTGFFVQLCQGDCFDAAGNLLPDGMYVKNDTGLISMTTEQGEIMLAQGQSAFAASSHDAPQQIHQPLAAYNIAVNDVETFDFDIGDSVPPTKPIILGRMESVFAVSTIEMLATTGHVVDSSLGDTITQDTENNITAYNFTNVLVDFLPATFDSAGGTLVESGADQNLGVVWSRWTGGYTLKEGGADITPMGDIHLIGAAQLTTTLPTAGTISYQSSAGTAPTFIGPDGSQLTGTQNVAFDIDYATTAITGLSVTASFAGGDITAGSMATSGDFIAAGSTTVLLSGVCPPTLCNSVVGLDTQMDGSISINLVGANAEGAYGSYGLTNWMDTSVTGSYLATQTATATSPLVPQ